MQNYRFPRRGIKYFLAFSLVIASLGARAAGLPAPVSIARAETAQKTDFTHQAWLPVILNKNDPEAELNKKKQVPPTPTPTPLPPSGGSSIYWGAYIDGKQYGKQNPPWDMGAVDAFESHTGKKISILHFGLPWSSPAPCWPGSSGGSTYYPFQPSLMNTLRGRGIIPMIDWASWSRCGGTYFEPAKYTLAAIASGTHDAYIRQWAMDAKTWGHPFFLRMDWEMNGSWFPWSEQASGNSAGQYVQMWQHVHDIFNSVGATNVNWVWCPNVTMPEYTPIDQLYPGDAYVDWTCIDGYNKGPAQSDTGTFKSFYQVFKATYDQILAIAPGKPVMIGETSSTESGGSKADWILDTLTKQLPVNFPKIKALVWFNWNCDNFDWVIETSAAAQSAFASGIASSYYKGSDFSTLDISPIPAP